MEEMFFSQSLKSSRTPNHRGKGKCMETPKAPKFLGFLLSRRTKNSLTTVVVVLSLLRISIALDTITVNQNIRDGEAITSAGGSFELGFFSLGNSKNRYLGIWYKKGSRMGCQQRNSIN